MPNLSVIEKSALIEELARLEHNQWVKWSQSVAESEPISESRSQRWTTLWVPYADLPENVKEQDRQWARMVFALIEPYLAKPPKTVKPEVRERVREVYIEHADVAL